MKHGYSKVTDQASREIRHGRLTRIEGLKLVRHFEKNSIQNSQIFCDWLDIDHRGLQFIIDRHRNPKFWTQIEPGKWEFHSPHNKFDEDDCNGAASDINFESSNLLNPRKFNRYITIGKGYP